MAKLVARLITVSLDGYTAALKQGLKQPFGDDGIKIMNWAFKTQTFKKMFGQDSGGSEGIDNDFAKNADQNIGATLMGRNMFSPLRGPWENEDWKGWWGEDPPYHHPVFVLTHHARKAFDMQGGTSFSFVSDGLESGLRQAFAAAKGKDVRVGGGANCIRQCIQAGLLDELHMVQTREILGGGETLLAGLGEALKRYEVAESKASDQVVHVILKKKIRT